MNRPNSSECNLSLSTRANDMAIASVGRYSDYDDDDEEEEEEEDINAMYTNAVVTTTIRLRFNKC